VFSRPAPAAVALAATPDTCHWGYIDPDEPVVLEVESGAVVDIDTVTHHAGDAPDLLMDEGIRQLWAAFSPGERAPGVHLLTGPLRVRGAKPGMTLAVEIQHMSPRLPFGSNCAANWGLLYSRFGKERITIYELEDAVRGEFPEIAVPRFAYDFVGRPVYDEPGFISEPDSVARQEFSRDVRIPVRPHFGVLGVAPGEPGRRSSIPPGVFGGNVDNWRIGPGAVVYYPVFAEGAGLYAGDPHFAQGDGEVCGTAIEASASGRLRVAAVDDLPITAPVIATATHWYTHGFGDDLDAAAFMAVENMIRLLGDRAGLSADDAYSVASVAMDLSVTQVVDTVVGCHAGIPVSLFAVP
jgi:acetamidase/formamidase